MTPLQLEQAAETAGMPVDELRQAVRRAGWDWQRVDLYIRTGTVGDALREELERAGKARDRQARERVRERLLRALGGGPAWTVDAEPRELVARLDPRLAPFVADYSPDAGGLLIVGPTGVGKTLAAALIVRRLVEQRALDAVDALSGGRVIVWSDATAIARARAMHSLGDGEAPSILEAERAALFVLDDWGWEDERSTAIAEVLQARYNAGRPTVATSGHTLDSLEARVGGAVLRRLLQAGGVRGRVVDLFRGNR